MRRFHWRRRRSTPPVSRLRAKNRAAGRGRSWPDARCPGGSSCGCSFRCERAGRSWWSGTLPSADMQPKVTRAGDRGLLADFGAEVAAAELHARAAALRARANVAACIVGQQSLYVIFDGEPSTDFDDVPPSAFTPRTHVIDVDFSGPDLDEFLAHVQITRYAFLQTVP